MKLYKRHRFPPDIISYAVWLYYGFNLSYRDIDEVFVKINGKRHYLWRAVDQDGEVVDLYLQASTEIPGCSCLGPQSV